VGACTAIKRRIVRVLPVVGEDEQALALRVLKHVLGEHVDVRDRHRADRTRRFAVPPVSSPPAGFAAEAGTKAPMRQRIGLEPWGRLAVTYTPLKAGKR